MAGDREQAVAANGASKGHLIAERKRCAGELACASIERLRHERPIAAEELLFSGFPLWLRLWVVD